MSVLRTREAFFLGFGAMISAIYMVSCIWKAGHTILVFGHVEPPEQHDGFFAVVSSFSYEWLVGVNKVTTLSASSDYLRFSKTYEEFTSITLPHPPNLSFPHPYTTLPIPICRNALAHMTHGSTVT
jgi:hypothetical protein